MKQKQMVNACIQIALRDFGAFEDLANELGYELKLEGVDKVPNKKPQTKNKVTPEFKKQVTSAIKSNPEMTDPQIKKLLKAPHSPTTINRIRHYG
ncbi:MAG: hypothetical protein DRI65_13565 [Chloroflexota bacterium]|nr:MAG: hypothetical protein DRI65_13565 [Chloroflexota bacterium]